MFRKILSTLILTAALTQCIVYAEAVSEPTGAPEANTRTVLALESDKMLINDELTETYKAPFMYKDTTYVPLRVIAEALSAEVLYNHEDRSVRAVRDWHIYATRLDAPDVHNIEDTLYVPLRQMCNDLGYYVFWDDGLIAISLNDIALSAEEVSQAKLTLGYNGFHDIYFVPKTIVNPRITYTYEQLLSDIHFLKNAYPDLISAFSIGKSAEGRELIGFTLGKGSKKVVMCASMHAREHISTNVLMYLADSYALGYVNGEIRDGYDIRWLLDNVTLIIIPMVNPDGINIVQNGYEASLNPEYVASMPSNMYGNRGWKANANGVDLNNNFDHLWYSKGNGPSYAGYGGPYAASEAETQAMQNFINDSDYEVFASLHTQGQVVYWMDPNCDRSLVEKFSPHITRLCNEIGFIKMPSDGTKGFSGYMTDYIRYYRRKMAMTIELCPYIGDYPYPEADFDRVAYPVRNLGLILADICLQLG